MQVANRQDFGERLFGDESSEKIFRQVVASGRQQVLAVGRLFEVPQVRAVMHRVFADHDEQDIGILLGNEPAGLHEDVETAHFLKPARDVGDDPLARFPNLLAVDDSLRVVPTVIDGRVDAVEDDFDFRPKLRREEVALVVRWRPTSVAVREVGQDHRVLGLNPQQSLFINGQLFAVAQVTAGRPIEHLHEVDDRRVVQERQEQRRSKPGVSDDQVRLNVRPLLEHFVNAVSFPNDVLEILRTEMIGLGRAPFAGIDDLLNPRQ